MRKRLIYFTEAELRFYQKLPNLKHLSLQQDASSQVIKAPDAVAPLPQSFSKLTALKVQDIAGFPVWDLIELSTNIKTFAYQNMDGKAEPISCLLTILNRNHHKKLQILDIEDVNCETLHLDGFSYHQLMSELYAVVVKCNLKLINVTPQFFVGMCENHRNLFAARVLSLRNVFDIDLLDCPEDNLNVDCFPDLEAIQQSHRICQNSRLKNTGLSSRGLATIWSNFGNIEELYFEGEAPVLDDVAFIGEG